MLRFRSTAPSLACGKPLLLEALLVDVGDAGTEEELPRLAGAAVTFLAAVGEPSLLETLLVGVGDACAEEELPMLAEAAVTLMASVGDVLPDTFLTSLLLLLLLINMADFVSSSSSVACSLSEEPWPFAVLLVVSSSI